MFRKLCFLTLLSFSASVFGFNRTIPHSALIDCKEHRIEKGYSYRTYRISDFQNNKPLSDEVLRMKMYVFCTNDGHILVSNEPNIQWGDPGYEIVLGGWGNSKSVMRNSTQGPNLYNKYGQVCSELYATEVILILKKDGFLSVTLPGYSRPYMSIKDYHPSHTIYLGFASWEDKMARWFYDCPLGVDAN